MLNEVLPWVLPAGVIGLIAMAIRLIFRGRLVPKSEIDRIERDKKEQIALHAQITDIHKEIAADKQKTIVELTASVDKLTVGLETNNSLLQGLIRASEITKNQADKGSV